MDQLLKRVTHTPIETVRLGERLGRLLRPGDFVSLVGDLGAGKTVFVKGIARGMGLDPDEVQSPTFTLVREYRNSEAVLYHLDLYRLEEPESELWEIGYDEYFPSTDGVTAVEWSDRALGLLPKPRLEVRIRAQETAREVVLLAVEMEEGRAEGLRGALERGDDRVSDLDPPEGAARVDAGRKERR